MIERLKGIAFAIGFLAALVFGTDPTEGEHDPY